MPIRVGTDVQILPENSRPHLVGRANQLSRQAATLDTATWARLQERLGRPPSIWEYEEYKLVEILETARRPGQAAWAWRSSLPNIVHGFIWSSGCSEGQQSIRWDAANAAIECNQWWPVIWAVLPDTALWPMYCPALAWQGARPWFCHRSRVWTFPAHWTADIQLISVAGPTSPPLSTLSSTASESTGFSSSMTSWVVPTAQAQQVIVHDSDQASHASDIANLEDVTSIADGSAITSILSTGASSSDSASTTVTTERRRRWGNKKSK